MPNLLPFSAIRYADAFDLEDVTAPPYDVISPEERIRLASRHPKNFVHLTMPEGTEDDRYTGAGDMLRAWVADGTFRKDESESFFLYRSDSELNGRRTSTAGVICLLELERFGEGSIYAHEKTMPGPKADRLRLMQTTAANLEPLWFVAGKDPQHLKEEVDRNERVNSIATVADADGVSHRVWSLPPDTPVVDELRGMSLIVADGHHRYETAITYRDERRAASGPGPWDFTLVLVSSPNLLAPTLRPIHRIIDGPPPDSLRGEVFNGDIDDLTRVLSERGPGQIGIATREGLRVVASKGELDTEFLAEQLQDAGITPRYEHHLETVITEVNRGNTAFLMAPVPISLVVDRALRGRTMPPKTTLFWPKPRSGIVFRLL